MLIKFTARGKRGGAGPIGYLLGEFGTKPDGEMPSMAEMVAGIGRRSVAPRLLRGDPAFTVSAPRTAS